MRRMGGETLRELAVYSHAASQPLPRGIQTHFTLTPHHSRAEPGFLKQRVDLLTFPCSLGTFCLSVSTLSQECPSSTCLCLVNSLSSDKTGSKASSPVKLASFLL